MSYENILKTIAKEENRSVQEVEDEMKQALKAAGITCSVEEFVLKMSEMAKKEIMQKYR